MQNATDNTDKLYPEIDEAGGLDNLLNETFRQIGSSCETQIYEQAETWPFYQSDVVYNNKISQVTLAAELKSYSLDYWRDGVCLANGWTENITLIAQSIDFWMNNDVPTAELAEKYYFVKPTRKAAAFDAGTEVEFTWNEILHKESHPELHDFVALAMNDEILGGLFPFISMSALCFSNCTGYAYDTNGLPIVIPKRFSHFPTEDDQLHNVSAFVVAKDFYNYLGEGSAEEALKIVRDNLPADIKPAVKGTADGKP